MAHRFTRITSFATALTLLVVGGCDPDSNEPRTDDRRAETDEPDGSTADASTTTVPGRPADDATGNPPGDDTSASANSPPNPSTPTTDATVEPPPSDDARGPVPEGPTTPATGSPHPGADAGVQPSQDEPTSPPIANPEIGNDVFDDQQIKSYYLTFTDEEYAKLTDLSTLVSPSLEVNTDRYVEAALRVDDVDLPSIGVRFKGDYSIWGCVVPRTGERVVRVDPLFGDVDVCQRFSLKLDFDRYDDGARVNGLKKLNLHAMSADPSKLRERLGYSLFRDMGIIAPRMAHARVYINGEYHGLFAAVEQIDGRFTANRFPNSGDGNLYKQIWPAAHVTSSEAEAALKTNDEPELIDVSDFLELRDSVVAATEMASAEPLTTQLDFDALARYIVVDRAINNYDGILLFWPNEGHDSNHNFYWYHDAESARFILIPWDLDKTFWFPEPLFWTNNAPYEEYDVPNWNVISSTCDYHTTTFDALGFQWRIRPMDCDPLLKILREEIYDRQLAIAEEFIAGPYSQQSVGEKLEAWRTQISQAIEDDPLVDSAHWANAVELLFADLPNFHENLHLMMSGMIEE